MRRTISGAAIAVLASATLLAGCADDSTTTDPEVDPAVTEAPLDDSTVGDDTMGDDTMDDDMATMEPTDS